MLYPMPKSKRIVLATININGLPTFYHVRGAEEVLVPYKVRHKEICKWFEKSDVDIINFQEVFTYQNLQLLRKCLPSYHCVSYKPFLFGPKGALVTFSRFPLVSGGYTSFASSITKVNRAQLPKISLLRSALKGMYVVQVEGMPLTIINTHLLYNADGDWSVHNRFHNIQKSQLDCLSGKVKSLTSLYPENRIVVSGDFNIEVGELTKRFLRKNRLYDVFEGDTAPSFHNEFLADIKTKFRIDYLLISDNSMSVLGQQRIFTGRSQLGTRGNVYLTDHQGLKARLSLPPHKL